MTSDIRVQNGRDLTRQVVGIPGGGLRSALGHLPLGQPVVEVLEGRCIAALRKLDADRVQALIDSGTADSFAPAGRIFKEWAAISDACHWEDLLREAIAKADR